MSLFEKSYLSILIYFQSGKPKESEKYIFDFFGKRIIDKNSLRILKNSKKVLNDILNTQIKLIKKLFVVKS